MNAGHMVSEYCIKVIFMMIILGTSRCWRHGTDDDEYGNKHNMTIMKALVQYLP